MSLPDVAELVRTGQAWLDVRRYDQALDVATQALAREPSNAAAHVLASRALMMMERYPEAVVAARTAVGITPQWAYAYRILSLAMCKAPGGSTRPAIDEAVQVASEAVRLAPGDAYNHMAVAEASALAARFGVADEAARRAIALAPASADVWATASYVALKTRNWFAAEIAARRALLLDPDHYAATNNLGAAMKGRGWRRLGAVAFLGAARIDPRRRNARENLEAIGFEYIEKVVAPTLLLPLALFWPLYLVTRFMVVRHVVRSKPAWLRPLARRLGLRVATSDRARRLFDRHNQRIEEWMSRPDADAQWSALRTRQQMRTANTAAVIAVCIFALGGFVVAAMVESAAGFHHANAVIAVAAAVVSGGFAAFALRRRTDGPRRSA